MKQRETDCERIINTFNIPEMKRGTIKGKVDRLYIHRLSNQCYIDICWLFKDYFNDYKTGDVFFTLKANNTIK